MNITKGVLNHPQKVCLYGPEGIGKSTFASQFPAAIRELALTVADEMTLEARCQLTDDLQKIVEEVRP